MNKYCTNCGKALKEGADVCLNCGIILNKVNNQQIKKNGGKGSAIAGMVLGIIAVAWSFLTFLDIGEIPYALKYYYNISQYISFAFAYTFFSLAPSIVGLCLTISSLKKKKCGMNTAGLVLNLIALLISVILIFTIFSNY